jgi:hypothetical protein
VPCVLAAVKASSMLLVQGSIDGVWSWIELLMVFDVVFVTAGILVYPVLCEE